MNLNIVKYKYVYLGISLSLVIIAIFFLILWGVKLGIDFTGGTTFIYKNENVNLINVDSFLSKNYPGSSIVTIGVNTYQVQTPPLNQKTLKILQTNLSKKFKLNSPEKTSTIGPTIGTQLTKDAIYSVIVVILGIIIYIAWSFRSVPKPANSIVFGGSAVIAMLHDVIVVFGAFAILGHFFDAPVDSLFVTAVLTVIGFSVHDTIVVFDRIRENLVKKKYPTLKETINKSLVQTFNRSLNTSFTVLLVLSALFLLGGITIRWFAIALLIGIFSGTYSSIFVASQLLVVFADFKEKKKS
ncbi:protein translocase subunit SecF [Patescibacteria group bacterium]|nr:protein translocase subunit SecF [Patescibacteria group bacterium]